MEGYEDGVQGELKGDAALSRWRIKLDVPE
jgi:hypothetical protein